MAIRDVGGVSILIEVVKDVCPTTLRKEQLEEETGLSATSCPLRQQSYYAPSSNLEEIPRQLVSYVNQSLTTHKTEGG